MKSASSIRRVVIITAIAAAACLGIAAIIGVTTSGFVPGRFGKEGIAVDESKSLSMTGTALITIDSVSEEVRVTEGTGTDIQARLHGTVSSTSADAVPHLSAQARGSTADIGIDRKPVYVGIEWSNLVLDVSVPKGYKGKLEVHSVSGSLDVAGHPYEALTLRTTSGSMRADAVSAGRFAARTTSGSLSVASLAAGSSEISSTSGSIKLTGVSGDLSATSVSGEVEVSYTAMPGKLDVQTTSGSVRVQLPTDASFTLDARSTSGDVTCRFPMVVQDSSGGGGHHVLAGKVGSGAGLVTVRTVSGGIRVTR